MEKLDMHTKTRKIFRDILIGWTDDVMYYDVGYGLQSEIDEFNQTIYGLVLFESVRVGRRGPCILFGSQSK